ncbi:MAG: acetyltransferase [Cyclobacteriaceae bacterium]|nr:acetyltransferase [Cytophagales bacterium]MCZ8327607.1 acetyltransferase [Cyclobacteriaceae bacterium]
MAKPIYIIGAGGLGSEMLALLKSFPEYSVNGFYDDKIKKGDLVHGLICLGSTDTLYTCTEPTILLLAIGDPLTKSNVIQKLSGNSNLSFPTFIHPKATILNEDTCTFGKGTIVTAGVVLTTQIKIRDFVLLNLNSTIGHDVIINDYCSVMPGANLAGNVQLYNSVLVGSGANVLNGISVGENARIGSGAVVTKQVLSNQTVVGIPAKPIG